MRLTQTGNINNMSRIMKSDWLYYQEFVVVSVYSCIQRMWKTREFVWSSVMYVHHTVVWRQPSAHAHTVVVVLEPDSGKLGYEQFDAKQRRRSNGMALTLLNGRGTYGMAAVRPSDKPMVCKARTICEKRGTFPSTMYIWGLTYLVGTGRIKAERLYR